MNVLIQQQRITLKNLKVCFLPDITVERDARIAPLADTTAIRLVVLLPNVRPSWPDVDLWSDA